MTPMGAWSNISRRLTEPDRKDGYNSEDLEAQCIAFAALKQMEVKMLNHIVIMGRLTRDPELRKTGSGTSVASFTLAVERDAAPKDGERGTDFIDCVAWGKSGEFVVKYFVKGQMAVVEGRLQVRPWQDRDGNSRRSAEINAESIYFGDSKKER